MITRLARSSGFSFIEILIAVALLGVIAAIAIIRIDGVNDSVRLTKLETDVAAINHAVKVYVGSGGSVDEISDPQRLLNRLKAVRESEESARITGLREAMIDERLVARMQTASEAITATPRALWIPADRRFEIYMTGGIGVSEFYLDETLAGEEDLAGLGGEPDQAAEDAAKRGRQRPGR